MSLVLRRFLSVLGSILLVAFAVAPSLSGCGRSGLEQPLVFDAGTSTPAACGPSTCSGGCCDATGTCRIGTDIDACGRDGEACNECLALGLDACNEKSKSCSKTVVQCDPKSCPSGCCAAGAKGPECVLGAADGACGTAGEACIDCKASKLACDTTSKLCGVPKCNPETCKGCCVGDVCLVGTEPSACGVGGLTCTDCDSTGQACEVVGEKALCTGTPSCGPANCDGCCIGDICIPGFDDTACGLKGVQCTNCGATGSACSAARTCGPKPKCGPDNCAGCCSGDVCVVATTSLACGKGGETCKTCGTGNACNAGVCQPSSTCGPGSCPDGCCVGAVCAIGNQNGACGSGGGACADCALDGRVCTGNACRLPTCGPDNCAGCCQGNTCVLGTQDGACGAKGAACTACGANESCTAGGVCQQDCNAVTCPGGCCQNNTCFGGFTTGRCGSGGAACQNCGAGTCSVAGLPRTCTVPGTCPATYGTCGFGIATTRRNPQAACDAAELLDAEGGCVDGVDSPGCTAYFDFVKANNPQCAACLAPFAYSFEDLQGVYACIAPYVTDACNRATGCQMDCQEKSCAGCGAGQRDACESAVLSTNCQVHTTQTSCVLLPLFTGQGLFCNPANPAYGNNFGAWLAGVGTEYCGK